MRRLRAWRLEQLLSIERLAKEAGVSNRTIIDIEHGRVRPKLRTVGRLCRALGVDPGEVTEFVAVIRPWEFEEGRGNGESS